MLRAASICGAGGQRGWAAPGGGRDRWIPPSSASRSVINKLCMLSEPGFPDPKLMDWRWSLKPSSSKRLSFRTIVHDGPSTLCSKHNQYQGQPGGVPFLQGLGPPSGFSSALSLPFSVSPSYLSFCLCDLSPHAPYL